MSHAVKAMVIVFAVSAAIVATGCPAPRDFIECVEDSNCGLAANGECLANPDTGHKFCAYPDAECPTGQRWSDYDVEQPISGECVALPGVDAGTDAPFDAPALVSFDVGFVSQWEIGGDPASMTEYEWVRVVNTGAMPLDLAGGQVTNLTVDDNRFPITATWQTVTTVLNPASSAGALTSRAIPFVVSNGLVPEPAQNTAEGLITFRIDDFPPSGVWFSVDAEITLRIGNARATLPVRVINSGTNITPAATAGMRVSSVPIP